MRHLFFRNPGQWAYALCLIFLIHALTSCARGPTKPTAPDTMEGATIKIRDISFREEPTYTRVIIEGSEPLKYTFFKLLTDPLRIAIDIPNGQFEDIPVPIDVSNGTLTQIDIGQYEGKGRIEIGLTKTVNYNITKVEKKLFVDVERTGPVEVTKGKIEVTEERIPSEAAEIKAKAEKITQVTVDKGKKAVSVTVIADGRIGDYNSFKLDKPARLVIDIWNVKKDYPKNLIQIDHPLLKRVRMGKHPNKTRFVFDSARPQVPQFQINKAENRLVVSLGQPEEALPTVAGLGVLTGIDFKQMDHKSRIVVSTSDVATYDVFKLSGTAVALHLKKMRVPQRLKRALDTKAFDSAVDYISIYNVKSETSRDVRIIVRMREGVDFEASQEGKRIYLDFEKPAKPIGSGRTLKTTEPPEFQVSAAESEKAKTPSQGSKAETVEAETEKPESQVAKLETTQQTPLEKAEAVEKQKVSQEGTKATKEAAPPAAQGSEKKEVTPDPLRAKESILESLAAKKRYTGRKLSLDFKDADIKNILRLIAEVSDLNIIAGEDVKGKVTLRLVDVPWDQALDIILQSNDLGKVRIGNVVRVALVDKLKKEEEDALAARRAKEKLEDLGTELIAVNYATAKELEPQVQGILTDRGSVTVDERTNVLVVKDIRSAIGEARSLVTSLDTKTPQVLIEARIVEASANFTRELGVIWGGTVQKLHGATTVDADGNPIGTKGRSTYSGGLLGTDTLVNLPLDVARGAISFGWLSETAGLRNLDITLQALEDSGNGKVISSPRITTLDNTEAYIERGDRIPYLKITEEGTVTTEFIEANLKLTVTPHVTNDGTVKLKIKVSNDEPDFDRTVQGVPTIKKKEAVTEALVKDNDIIVIGGVYDLDEGKQNMGIPYLSRIPVLGWFFKYEKKAYEKTDLLIFISPKILKDRV
ncbi:MAG: type IV pilus secretin PilQ [Deltaproteobacteria bacterium]|nr:type IV pilus secretin PilQ [Deltaproteobacteria bacterium]